MSARRPPDEWPTKASSGLQYEGTITSSSCLLLPFSKPTTGEESMCDAICIIALKGSDFFSKLS